MYVGQQTSADTVYLFKEYESIDSAKSRTYSKELGEWVEIETDILRPVIRSGKIARYTATTTALILFPYEVINNNARLYTAKEMQTRFPLAWSYLKRNRRLLEDREKGKFKDDQWYRFGRSQNLGMWEQPKIMVPYMITNLAAYYDVSDNYYFINVTTGGYGITVDESKIDYVYLCGLLNSRLLDFYLKQVSTNFRSGYMAANKQYIEQLPIRTIDFTDPADVKHHDEMVALVMRMLELHKRMSTEGNPQVVTMIQRQIAATDQQIDQLVYKLYMVSQGEIDTLVA